MNFRENGLNTCTPFRDVHTTVVKREIRPVNVVLHSPVLAHSLSPFLSLTHINVSMHCHYLVRGFTIER